MISENIKNARKKKGMSQEEMAVRLNVVRQTVSKWETGRSVPDAEMLIQIAELLDVSVNLLLGAEPKDGDLKSLTDELARVNGELVRRNRKAALLAQAGKKRGLIIFLSFAAMLAALTIKSEPAAIIILSCCMLAALIILYSNLALLTAVSTEELRLKPLRLTTIFDIVLLMIAVAIVVLRQAGTAEVLIKSEKWIAALIASAVMLFGGYISPRLPYNRHTGLRLPWTVRDEETWNAAHRIIGYISIPCVLLILAANMTISRAEIASAVIFAMWICIPGVLSLVFFLKKFYR